MLLSLSVSLIMRCNRAGIGAERENEITKTCLQKEGLNSGPAEPGYALPLQTV